MQHSRHRVVMQESCMLGLESADTMEAEAEAQVLPQALLSKEVARGLKEGGSPGSLQDPGFGFPGVEGGRAGIGTKFHWLQRSGFYPTDKVQ